VEGGGAYLLLLADTVSAVHRLQIYLWVPVRVEKDDSVRGGEVDAETTSTSGQKEGELW
jgi:hypothetical protein